MFISFRRSLKHATRDFIRNFWLTALTVTIVSLALLSINAVIVVRSIASQGIRMVADRVDLAITFRPEITRTSVEKFLGEINSVEHVARVERTDRDQRFKELGDRYTSDRAIQNAISAVGTNPLGDLLIVKASSLDDYPAISTSIESIPGLTDAGTVHMRSTKAVLERIQKISSTLERGIKWLAILFGLIALLVVINTIRIVFYTHREEISIMRLVGASHMMIRGPFIITMLLINFCALILSALVTYGALAFLIPKIENYLAIGTQVFPYGLVTAGLPIFVIEFVLSSLIILIVSSIALRRYLKS